MQLDLAFFIVAISTFGFNPAIEFDWLAGQIANSVCIEVDNQKSQT